MAKIPEELIKEIRNRNDIVDVVSQYVSLTKKGKNYWGLSPFRDDKNPSLSVSPDKQIYMDFATHEGGNVFTFIQRIENIDFIDAVFRLGQRVGIDLSQYESKTEHTVDPQKQILFDILNQTSAYYEYELTSSNGQKAMEHVQNRGYDLDTIKKFKIGYAASHNNIIEFLEAKGFKLDDMIKTDIVRYHNEDIRPVFYNRITFPISDPYGNVVGFSARTLDSNSNIKYINTKETELYLKSNILYNYDNAKTMMRKHGFAIITEGVTDTITFSMAGYDNTVALLGVNCSDMAISLIKKQCREVLLAFDDDLAGKEATYNIGKKLEQAQCKVSVWYNDSGLDPDELYRKEGKKAIENGIKEKLDWLDFIVSYAIGMYGINSFENRKNIVEFTLPHLNNKDKITQEYYLELLAKRLDFNYQTLYDQLYSLNTKRKIKHEIQTQSLKSRISIPEKRLLTAMVLSKQASYLYRDRLGFLVDPIGNELALMILDIYRNQESLDIADLYLDNQKEEIQQLLNEITLLINEIDFNEKDVLENIQLIKIQHIQQGVGEIHKQIIETNKLEDQIELLNQALESIRVQNKKGKD